MEYRQTRFEDGGFESEHEELEAIRDYVQSLSTEPNDIADQLLMVANLCAERALMTVYNPARKKWYEEMSTYLRTILTLLTRQSSMGRPARKLETEYLYCPDSENTH